jgi:hypothetical protein
MGTADFWKGEMALRVAVGRGKALAEWVGFHRLYRSLAVNKAVNKAWKYFCTGTAVVPVRLLRSPVKK